MAILDLLRAVGLHPFARLLEPKEQPLLLGEGTQGESAIADPEPPESNDERED